MSSGRVGFIYKRSVVSWCRLSYVFSYAKAVKGFSDAQLLFAFEDVNASYCNHMNIYDNNTDYNIIVF